ncbi:hypothetical protein BpHYR1_018269 [Brachionus plicatilis]|uniref:Uncharacterized protein n=1 Tax=Brachionus plicatilis TaxID=10195 RepID=A0A3M7QMH3_BRAPC|nr:hypothetical protein BpHYR1_018269 [Brachionus plicatilis]
MESKIDKKAFFDMNLNAKKYKPISFSNMGLNWGFNRVLGVLGLLLSILQNLGQDFMFLMFQTESLYMIHCELYCPPK